MSPPALGSPFSLNGCMSSPPPPPRAGTAPEPRTTWGPRLSEAEGGPQGEQECPPSHGQVRINITSRLSGAGVGVAYSSRVLPLTATQD